MGSLGCGVADGCSVVWARGCGFIQDVLWGRLTPVRPWVRCALWTRSATSSVAKGASTQQVPQPRPAKALPEQRLPQASAVLLFISLRLFLLSRSLMAARAWQPGIGLSVAPRCGTGLRHRLAPVLPSLHQRSFGKWRATSRAAQGRNETSGSSRCKPRRLCAREVPNGPIPGLSVQYSAPSSSSQSQVPPCVIPSRPRVLPSLSRRRGATAAGFALVPRVPIPASWLLVTDG